MSSRKLSTTVYVDEDRLDALHDLSAAMRVPVAELIRQGIDLALAAHRDGQGFGAPTARDEAPGPAPGAVASSR